jgi:hypothetical protein
MELSSSPEVLRVNSEGFCDMCVLCSLLLKYKTVLFESFEAFTAVIFQVEVLLGCDAV